MELEIVKNVPNLIDKDKIPDIRPHAVHFPIMIHYTPLPVSVPLKAVYGVFCAVHAVPCLPFRRVSFYYPFCLTITASCVILASTFQNGVKCRNQHKEVYMIPNKSRKWSFEFGFMGEDNHSVIDRDEIDAETIEAATAKAELMTIKVSFERMNDVSFDGMLNQTPAIWGKYDEVWICYFKQPVGSRRYYTSLVEVAQPNHIKGFPRKELISYEYDGKGVVYYDLYDSQRTDNDCQMYCVARHVSDEDINAHWYKYLSDIGPERRGPYWNVVLSNEVMKTPIMSPHGKHPKPDWNNADLDNPKVEE